jgi:hypothetical protein
MRSLSMSARDEAVLALTIIAVPMSISACLRISRLPAE